MNDKTLLILIVLFHLLSACSFQSSQLVKNSPSISDDTNKSIPPTSQEPPPPISELTRIKYGKTLKLVRIMEGGVCKNEKQGAIGLFKLYASPKDIVHIEEKQGTMVFADFEQQIIDFSMLALQHAIDQLNFHANKSSQKQLTEELSQLFSEAITEDISIFETRTKLTIDVSPILDSLTIYLNGCETPHEH